MTAATLGRFASRLAWKASSFDPDNRFSTVWWWVARYHALALRQWVGVYCDRAGYDQTWQRRYRRSTP